MAGNDEHLSIGDVLSLLQAEFPDITVSKIRFLESQGLIAPERTPSGYRKFHDPDVERLRWILRQQKDHYLPLKVIKGRLAQLDAGVTPADDGHPPSSMPADAAAPAVQTTASASSTASAATTTATLQADDVSAGVSGASLTREELAEAAGVEARDLTELEKFGLLPPPRPTESGPRYDEEALVVVRLARGFLRHGVEARHLRMYKTFADREAGFVQQVVGPMVRQRNPDARQRARETVAELAKLGSGLRAAMLRVALRDSFDE